MIKTMKTLSIRLATMPLASSRVKGIKSTLVTDLRIRGVTSTRPKNPTANATR